MKRSRLIYLLSVGLRGVTLLSKFAFIILLARLVAPDDLGEYGLISAAVGYAIFAVGFEFYTYSTREIINSQPGYLLSILKGQTVFYLLSYCSFLPIFVLMIYFGILPEGSEYWFIVILLFEHIAQEINRILITLNQQGIASFVLFVRQGFWCWIAIALMLVEPELRSIDLVYVLWLSGAFAATVIGLYAVLRNAQTGQIGGFRWDWIKKGALLSLPMLLAALALRGFFTFDRFAIEHIAGLGVLGAYTLFVSMTAAIQSFLDTILVSFAFPQIARLCSQMKYHDVVREMKRFASRLLLLSVLLCLGCLVTGYFLVGWLGKSEYLELFPAFIVLIIATFIYCISLVPHIGLYSLRKDHAIVLSQCCSFLLFVVFIVIAIFSHNINYILYGLIVCFLLLTILKSMAFISEMKKVKKLWR